MPTFSQFGDAPYLGLGWLSGCPPLIDNRIIDLICVLINWRIGALGKAQRARKIMEKANALMHNLN